MFLRQPHLAHAAGSSAPSPPTQQAGQHGHPVHWALSLYRKQEKMFFPSLEQVSWEALLAGKVHANGLRYATPDTIEGRLVLFTVCSASPSNHKAKILSFVKIYSTHQQFPFLLVCCPYLPHKSPDLDSTLS